MPGAQRVASGFPPDAGSGRTSKPGVHLLARLKKRRDFLRLAKGRKAVRRAFVLQMAARPAMPDDAAAGAGAAVRVGFTASRKVGGAVARNRAKRRLREAARAVLPGRALPGTDYVLVARAAVLTCRFSDLEAELASALMELARPGRGSARAPATPTASATTPSSSGPSSSGSSPPSIGY